MKYTCAGNYFQIFVKLSTDLTAEFISSTPRLIRRAHSKSRHSMAIMHQASGLRSYDSRGSHQTASWHPVSYNTVSCMHLSAFHIRVSISYSPQHRFFVSVLHSMSVDRPLMSIEYCRCANQIDLFNHRHCTRKRHW